MAEVDDGRLLGATPREQWHLGSAVEVYSNSDTQWFVGSIINEEPGTHMLSVLFGDMTQLKQKQISRVDAQLTAVGTHVRRPPAGWEVRHVPPSPPQLVQSGTGRRCSSLEEAWAIHFDAVRAAQAAQLAPHRQFPSSPTRGLGTVTLATTYLQAVEAAKGTEAATGRIGELEQQLEEERSKSQQLQAELIQTREERDAARKELAQVLAERERLHGRAPASAAVPSAPPVAVPVSVPNSWTPGLLPTSSPSPEVARSRAPTSPEGEGRDEGADTFPGPSHDGGVPRQPVATAPSESRALASAGSARDRRMSDKPVEIVVSVPRAMTHEELLEEQAKEDQRVASRSVRSLAQGILAHQVQRLPSAPVSALSQHVSLAAASQGPCRSFHQASPSVAMPGGGMRVVGNAPMSVAPSTPASFAAPPGGAQARFVQRPVAPAMAQQAFVSGYTVMR
mmetsp:Transcript_73795/g.130363  ORF Transcript_73795/g.130363 Transcript_73795/m.130363 type:complete len:451 (-) Transcript_73795:71-1423(-)|eukprot:CAMPEP_0197642316 /NCGR_PEP_ID=MMETSP1338-20131121/16012_1 /TAXON_ID=43686 ORGANISM="Pelagodinium beii, Strain RCC1491" /NCGR_SAMPLE_ID=MMETSP1338 /ASSEMBLY_ACC=CAM_ASM_000754 /LENGTH=450 /DNA_ID=CAMNT_0043215421 /DNA_START=39 /DNA_END=1391 /DNA_ORIENTATION=-